MRRLTIAVLAAASLPAAICRADQLVPPGNGAFVPAPGPNDFEPDHVLVRFKPGVDDKTVQTALGRAGVLQTLFTYEIVPGLRAVRVVPGKVDEVIAALAADKAVQYAERDYVRSVLSQTTEYGISLVMAPTVWPAGRGGGAKIAILDTGVDLSHPDLPLPIVMQSFIPGEAVDDYHTHGTHTSGLALARDNDIGVVGVAPSASLMTGKVLSNAGSGSDTGVIAGINWAVLNGANVISMSLGGGGASQAGQDACTAAYNANVLVVAAAGNGGNNVASFPAAYDNVISVAALDSNKVRASFSTYGPTVDLAAPGVNNNSTIPLISASATCAATSHASAVLSGSTFLGTLTSNVYFCGFGGSADFPGAVSGHIAHIRRRGTAPDGHTYSFQEKANNAVAAGAIGVIISNADNTGVFAGTLNQTFTIPVVAISQSDGDDLQNNHNGEIATITNALTGHGYAQYSGTSMATPHVAGVAALMYGIYGTRLTAPVLTTALETTAEDLGDPGRDDLYGYGLVRADLAKLWLDAHLPPLCPADYNHDGVQNPDDLSDYINDYFTQPQPPSADFNQDSFINPDDLSDFINAYFSGC